LILISGTAKNGRPLADEISTMSSLKQISRKDLKRISKELSLLLLQLKEITEYFNYNRKR